MSQLLLSKGVSSKVRNAMEAAKKYAAISAIENHVKDDFVVGIGSGSTIVYAVEALSQRVRENKLKNIVCIPSSFQARTLILDHQLSLSSLDENPMIDVSIDGCDEADTNLSLIKGGGGCLTQEKVLAQFSKKFVVVADYRKNSEKLGVSWKYVPIEVLPMAYKSVLLFIQNIYGGEVKLRMGIQKAGPVVTDNGNFLLDWYFPNEDLHWESISDKLSCTAGIVETGLFINMASIAYFGQEDKTVKIVRTSIDH